MLSEALARYAYHLWFGKVNPERLDADWNYQRSFKGQDPLLVLQGLIDSATFDAQLDERIPQLPVYPRLRDALAKYVAIRDAGGWPSDTCRANAQARYAGRACAIDQATPAGYG